MKHALVAITAALALAGCVSAGTKVTEDQTKQFQRGITPESEVVNALGTPSTREVADDGVIKDCYIYERAQVNAANFLPLGSILIGGVQGQSTRVEFVFDNKGILKSYSTSTGQIESHTGLLNQK